LPALGQTPARSPAAVLAAAPQHGGSGFTLLLLDYRIALGYLTEDLREGTAELADGADMVPPRSSVRSIASPKGLIPLLWLVVCSPFLRPAHRHRQCVGRGSPLPDGTLEAAAKMAIKAPANDVQTPA
jgi:hypothetical protein